MTAITLQLQREVGSSSRLAVFLISPNRQNAFSVSLPADLLPRQQAWRARFLRHHSAGEPPAEVVCDYGLRVIQAMNSWLQQDSWQPLKQALKEEPRLPLLIRCLDSDIEALPWESLALDREIWRQPPSIQQASPIASQTSPPARKPRILLLVGEENQLDINDEISPLQQLNSKGRIELLSLRGERSCMACLRQALLDKAGWDGLIFLGHSDLDPAGGGRLQLGDGTWMKAKAFAAELKQAANNGLQLVLLNSCSGMDLAHSASAAGISWTLCFRDLVPSRAATQAFTALLSAMQAGESFTSAIKYACRKLQNEGPVDSQLLLSGYTNGLANDLHLPLRRVEVFKRRLLRSNQKQLAAVASCCLLAGIAGLAPWNPISTYLLDRRLVVQRLWRSMTNQKGPIGPKLPVVLINPRTSEVDFGVSVSAEKPIVPRAALAEILRRIPINSVKRIGLDVVLDQPAAGTKELAAVLRKQDRQLVFSGWFSSNAAAVDAGRHTKGLSAELINTPLLTRKLDVNTPGHKPSQQTPQPLPLRLQKALTADNFAGTLSKHPAPLLPASAVIDWSINWGRLIDRIEPADLSTLKATALLVGTTGNINPEEPDRFKAPGAAAAELAELSGGSSREVPGVFVQAALAQSINLQHWLKPQPLLTITALSSGLGVLLAAAINGRRRRLLWLALISLISVIASLQLAVTSLQLFPLLLPLVALGSATMIRGDER